MRDRVERAIVLRHVDYGDADRIVRLLSPERGKIAALARGARSSRKRFAAALEPGNLVEVVLRPGKGSLTLVQSAELLHGRPHLRRQLEGLTLAAYFCDWADALSREDHSEPRQFGLLDVALLILDACTEPPSPMLRVGFEAKALTFAGLTPRLLHCTCGHPIEPPCAYDPASGGAVHQHCGSGNEVSFALLMAMERARRTRLVELVDAALPEPDEGLLHAHLAWHTGRALRSHQVLLQLGL